MGYNGASLQLQQNRRSFDTNVQPPLVMSNKVKLAWMALLAARQKQRALNLKKSQYLSAQKEKSQNYNSLIPLLYLSLQNAETGCC